MINLKSFNGEVSGTENVLVSRQGLVAVNTVATPIFTVALPALTAWGGAIALAARATDGVDQSIRSGSGGISAANKAGVLTFNFQYNLNTVQITTVAGSTLVITFAGVLAANVLTVSVTVTSAVVVLPTIAFDYTLNTLRSSQPVTIIL